MALSRGRPPRRSGACLVGKPHDAQNFYDNPLINDTKRMPLAIWPAPGARPGARPLQRHDDA